MDESYEMSRGERRSFFCSNKLWKELGVKANDCIPISQYIRMAVIEKMIKDNPKRKEYYMDLLVCDK